MICNYNDRIIKYTIYFIKRLHNIHLHEIGIVHTFEMAEWSGANWSHWTNVGFLLVHRLRRWPNSKPALVQYFVFTRCTISLVIGLFCSGIHHCKHANGFLSEKIESTACTGNSRVCDPPPPQVTGPVHSSVIPPADTRHWPNAAQCWPSVADGGSTLGQAFGQCLVSSRPGYDVHIWISHRVVCFWLWL